MEQGLQREEVVGGGLVLSREEVLQSDEELRGTTQTSLFKKKKTQTRVI